MGWPHHPAWVGFLVYRDPTQEAPNQSRACAEGWPQRGDSKLGDEDAWGSRQAGTHQLPKSLVGRERHLHGNL